MNSIGLLKSLDAVLGRSLAYCLPPRRQRSVSLKKNASVLFIRPGGIGDAVLLIPTIEALRRHTGARVSVLAEKRNSAIFRLCPDFEAIFCYDRPRELLRVLRLRPDLVIDTEQWYRLSAIIGRLLRPQTLIGFDTNSERHRLLDIKIPYSHDDHELSSFLHLLSPLIIPTPTNLNSPFLSIPADAAVKATALLSPLAGRPLVTLFSGASIRERQWGSTNFQQLAMRLEQAGFGIVTVGGLTDLEESRRIIIGTNGLNFAGKTSLAESAAIIDQSSLLISGDSGILHIAVGLGIPTVSLFGPGIAVKWAPRGGKHIVINKALPCSPCTQFGNTPKCPIGAKCLKEILVEEVFSAAMKLLRQ